MNIKELGEDGIISQIVDGIKTLIVVGGLIIMAGINLLTVDGDKGQTITGINLRIVVGDRDLITVGEMDQTMATGLTIMVGATMVQITDHTVITMAGVIMDPIIMAGETMALTIMVGETMAPIIMVGVIMALTIMVGVIMDLITTVGETIEEDGDSSSDCE